MTTTQLHVLQHSLGLDEHGRGRSYRNAFVTDPDGGDGAECTALCAMGLMHDHGARQIAGGMHCFSVTDAGRAAVVAESPPPPKVSRGRERYLAWLRADCDMKFGDWLKAGGR